MDPFELRVRPLGAFSAEIEVPGDKSISHRVAIIAGLSNGPCRVQNFLPSEDCLNTLRAMEALGVRVEKLEITVDGPTDLVIHGRRMDLRAPKQPIDCGNSGTGMRLLAGVLAGQEFKSTLEGDLSLSSRPMSRIIAPLEEMGARITAHGENGECAPLEIQGAPLQAIDYEVPVVSAQVKGAILLAGLCAKGKTTVVQPAPTRDHTERILAKFRVRTVTDGNAVSTYSGQIPESTDLVIPGDLSSAAFWIVAAAANPDSKLLVKDVGLNATRSALLPVLVRMGARIRDVIRNDEHGEPSGNVVVEGGVLRGTEIRPAEIPHLIDEIPVLAVAGALAQGRMVIRHAEDLQVMETARIAAIAKNLRAMGAEVSELDDGLEITGGHRLRGTTLDSFGDHRIAMAFAIAGLFAEGETVIKDTSCIASSYPGFQEQLVEIRKKSS